MQQDGATNRTLCRNVNWFSDGSRRDLHSSPLVQGIGMDRQERAQLLLEQEETGTRIQELRAALQHAGKILAALGNSVAASPETTTFANAPPPLGHMPLNLMHSRAFDWNSIPDKSVVAQKIQDLRELQEKLADVQRRLRR